jgi:2',3'-cyclic-nucleotide 2'-phosphodiesterase (5'-nucleotidase family)
MKSKKCKNNLILGCGDTIQGTYPIVKSKGKDLIPILNNLEFMQYKI